MSSLDIGTIVCFGDSLTQHGWDVSKRGWVAQLSLAYIRRMDVINRGYSGYTSRWALPVLPQILPLSGSGKEPRLLTILLGSNDALLPGLLRHVPIDEFTSNIESMVTMVTDPLSPNYSPNTKILLITPPPLGAKLNVAFWEASHSWETAHRTPESVKACADAIRQVAQKHALPCVDLWAAIEAKVDGAGGEFDGYDEFSWDGVHLNAGGNQLLFELVMQAIKLNYPELDPDVIPYVFADHKELAAAAAEGVDIAHILQRKSA
ncbi:isoamyl acetate-hydrolyzing esterase [Coemansia sp. 'formosensis']|nr:isoamyl acetate-hydrolyzing esterase [Coemansia sp. 'formosensis']